MYVLVKACHPQVAIIIKIINDKKAQNAQNKL